MKKIITTTAILLSALLFNSLQAQFAVYIQSDSVICEGEVISNIRVGLSGGQAPYAYHWSPSNGLSDTTVSNPVFAPLNTTTYTLSVTDNLGNTATDTFRIVIVQNLNDYITTYFKDGSCSTNGQGSIQVIAGTPPYQFLWNNGFTTNGEPSLASGNYSITVTDAQGCTGVAYDTIYPTLPYIDAYIYTGSISNCSPPYISVQWNNKAVWPYQIQWSTSATTQTIPNPQPGNYSVTVTDATGCTGTATGTIAGPIPIDSVISTDVSVCGAADGSVCVYVSGGTPPYSFNWSNGASNPTCINGLTHGFYSVIVTDGNNCSVSIPSIPIAEPVSIIGQIMSSTGGVLPDTLCVISTGGIPPLSFQWSGGTSLSSTCIEVTSAGQYVVTITDANNCTAVFYDTAGCTADCVWPGDANDNGLVYNTDLLPIGLAYGAIGTSRLQQDINWYGHLSLNWVDTLPSGSNYKHIDCDGNGTINADDTLAIIQNFGLVHAKTNDQRPWRMTDPSLYVELTPDTTQAGDTLYANITLGDINVPASNAYGLAFTLNYDASVVDTTQTKVVFGNSWLGTAVDKISIAKDFPALGQIKCALTRIDHTTRSGFGQIGQVSFVITTDNINGKNLAYHQMNVYITDLVMIDNLGNYITVNEGKDSSLVEFEPAVSAVNGQSPMVNFKIQPNPATDEVQFTVSDNLIGGEMKVLDVSGRVLSQTFITTRHSLLATSHLSQGLYFIQVRTEKGMLTKRLVIAR